ncbi:conjugal transfer protein TraJ, partial [Escherichia coli]|nr:conjugal transfer protein TraJ [Escherichia coli]
MDSYFSTYGVSYINNVLISAMSWSMVIETLNTNEGCFFVWRFIESNDKNISTSLISKSNDGLMFFSGEYVDIEPYLVGFSHYYS